WATCQGLVFFATANSKRDCPGRREGIVSTGAAFSSKVRMISRPIKSSLGAVILFNFASWLGSVWLRRARLVRLAPRGAYSVVRMPFIPDKPGMYRRVPILRASADVRLLTDMIASTVV